MSSLLILSTYGFYAFMFVTERCGGSLMLGGLGEKERVGGRALSREGEGEAGGAQEEGGGVR